MNGKKHWDFKTGRAEVAFNLVRWLTRLPPQAKREVVVGQQLPTLTYGSELHQEPREECSRLGTKFARWVVMGSHGSSREKIEHIVGKGKLEALTHAKRVRWAASICTRHELELYPRAERILKEELGEEVILRWMEGEEGGEDIGEAEDHADLSAQDLVEFTDGSRMGGAAGVTVEGEIFLGHLATVMDAEYVGIAGAWEEGYRVVASDSRVAIRRCINRGTGVQVGRSWIDVRILRAAKGRVGLRLVWVNGHSGVGGNEVADRRAKGKVTEGMWNSGPSLATPAGIRQAYPLYSREPQIK